MSRLTGRQMECNSFCRPVTGLPYYFFSSITLFGHQLLSTFYLYISLWFLMISASPILRTVYLWHHPNIPPSVVTSIPTGGEYRPYLRCLSYTNIPCSYRTLQQVRSTGIYQLLLPYQLRLSYFTTKQTWIIDVAHWLMTKITDNYVSASKRRLVLEWASLNGMWLRWWTIRWWLYPAHYESTSVRLCVIHILALVPSKVEQEKLCILDF